MVCCRTAGPLDRYSQIWNTIVIETGDDEITIFGSENTVVLKTWDYVDSLTDNGHISNRTNIRTRTSSISKSETDSIYAWTSNLTKNFEIPKVFCTDYVGYLKITIQYAGQVKQSCEYNSVCEWRTLTNDTKKLDGLLRIKFGEFQ
jgi:hypothetical protein